MRQELRAIRDRVTALLDALDTSVDAAPKTLVEGDSGTVCRFVIDSLSDS